ncbi:hypothetical protein [Maribacter sp. 2210JD10-5]|uniref:hypothetical protein n=1 Tax=Maribacter sp. 2210JD10-5 TaxID=3386272 RepID=UPI0039BC75A0
MKRTLIMWFTAMVLTFVFSSCKGDDSVDTEPVATMPPADVTLVTPADNEPCEEGESVSETERAVTFEWNAAENTASYDFQITNLETRQTNTQRDIEETSTTAVLVEGAPYAWKVVSKSDQTGRQGTSPEWRLYLAGEGIANYAPFAADLFAPLDGATFSTTTEEVTLEWLGVDVDDDALTYTVYYDTIDGKQEPIEALTDLSAQSVKVAVEAGTTYFWRVKTSDGSHSSFSQIVEFSTE